MVKDGYWWIEYSEYDGHAAIIFEPRAGKQHYPVVITINARIADFSTTEILNCIVEKIVDKHNEAMKRIQDAKP
jgi:hypothetical protein